MIIPLRTDRIQRRKPLVTEGLIVLNLLVYLTGLMGRTMGSIDLETLVSWGAFNPREFRVWQLFTSQFLHDPSSIWHIVFNMLFLWVFGTAVEDRIGRVGFVVFYLIGGAIACLAHAMVNQSPVIGASGAIAGVTGAFLALSPRSHVIVLFLIGFSIVAIPSLWFIGFYFVIDVLRQTGELLGAGGQRVAYMAHLAGYVYGFAVGFMLLATRIVKREESDVFFLFTQWRRRAALRAANQSAPSGLWDSATADTAKRLEREKKDHPPTAEETRLMELRAEVNRLAAAHDLSTAAVKYTALLREAPDTVFGEARQLELANQLYADGNHAGAAAAYELFADRYPRSSKAPEVRLILGVLYTRQLNHPARAREVIESARPSLNDPRQTALADDLLAELPR